MGISGGHYLSAMAINAATGNIECKKRMLYIIAELKQCQDANAKNHSAWGMGYVGGVPNSEAVWTSVKHGDFKAFHAAWVPWYNVHKMYAGLRDAWNYAGNEEAKNIFLKFCDWAINITSSLTDEQMQSMLDTEQGGMNEVLADAYAITNDEKYLIAAKRFSHKMLLDPMSQGIDNLDNKHANTQIPKAIGFERIGELSSDKKYLMQEVFSGKQLQQTEHLLLVAIVAVNFFLLLLPVQILLMMLKGLNRAILITCLNLPKSYSE